MSEFNNLIGMLNDKNDVILSQQARIDELQNKYDAMHNAFVFADDCRKEWHESYISACKGRDELVCMIDDHDLKLELFINELKKTYREDKDNKIDYWRGFSECADSSIKVFYRDVGFINLKGNKDEK